MGRKLDHKHSRIQVYVIISVSFTLKFKFKKVSLSYTTIQPISKSLFHEPKNIQSSSIWGSGVGLYVIVA